MSDDPTVFRLGDPLMVATNEGVHFNWLAIARCANLPLPGIDRAASGMDNMLSWQWRAVDNKFRTITLCRQLLAARHAGFLEVAQHSVDPIPPAPMNRPDDMQTPPKLVSHLDANGCGWVECLMPEEET